MLFNYKALDNSGAKKEGSIDAYSKDVAISSLQKRGLIISSIEPAEKPSVFSNISFFNHVSNKDVVILSRQMAILFNAQISALKIFNLISVEVENPILRKALVEVTDDLQSGSSISKALSKHPNIFSNFYVNMVKSGEETGKLNDTFAYLADHLDRNYEVVSKAKNALIYPAFVVGVFVSVMVLMFTAIIPKIAVIIKDSGQDIPFFTKVIFSISDFLLNYGLFLAAGIVIVVFLVVRYVRTDEGKIAFARFKLGLPYIGELYRKLYLSIIADNMNTMVLSGIPMVRAIEITSSVVDNYVYKQILEESLQAVKGGSSFSDSLSQYEEVPSMLIQMIKAGEETGELGNILKTMAKFYQREVVNEVDTLVDLIEPVMIVSLALGVGILLAAVLMPIYNIANAA